MVYFKKKHREEEEEEGSIEMAGSNVGLVVTNFFLNFFSSLEDVALSLSRGAKGREGGVAASWRDGMGWDGTNASAMYVCSIRKVR